MSSLGNKTIGDLNARWMRLMDLPAFAEGAEFTSRNLRS